MEGSWWADTFKILSSLSSPERNVCGEVLIVCLMFQLLLVALSVKYQLLDGEST